MSQLVKTRFIRSFQSYQLLSVKWLRSRSLLTAIYSLVRIRATVGLAGGLLAGGLLAGGLLAGELFPAGGFPCPRRGGMLSGGRIIPSLWVPLSTTRRHIKVERG